MPISWKRALYTGAPSTPGTCYGSSLEDIGVDRLRSMVVRPLTGFKFAPFYGCYIVRPRSALGFGDYPEREDSLESVIEAVGAEVVDYPGKTLCCGFPILTINQENSLKMVANHTLDAKGRGADAMVTPARYATSTSTDTSRMRPRPPAGPSACRCCTFPRCWGWRWASTPGP